MYEMCEKTFFKENLCVLQVFLCALILQPVCTRTCAQLSGNIGSLSSPSHLPANSVWSMYSS